MEQLLSVRPPIFHDAMRLRANNIFLICCEQDNPSLCMFMLPFDDECFDQENGVVWGMSGRVYVAGGYGEYGVMLGDVVMNYTQYLEKHYAARRIQRQWRRFKAAQVIKQAWKQWLTKKNELWNLRCFVGVAYLALDVARAIKAC